jgi:anti-anti-sigma regulatory factor
MPHCVTDANGIEPAMSHGCLVLRGDLDFEGRQAFIATADAAIALADAAGTEVELDCSAVESVEAIDDAVIGMLVTLARTAQRLGARVVLVRAAKPMRTQLVAAGVAHFFTWSS